MKYFVFCAFAAILLSGCGTVREPFDLGGSKSDGTVIVGANLGEYDKVNWSGALAKAKRRCRAWGYKDAEAFEGVRERCIAPGGLTGCQRKELSRTYQCLDEEK